MALHGAGAPAIIGRLRDDVHWHSMTAGRAGFQLENTMTVSVTPPLRWIDSGGSGMPLVFIHGWSCSLEDWGSQTAALQKDFRCIAIDLPGHGESAAPASPSIDEMAKGVGTVLEALGLGPAVLVGHSMGCRVAMQTWVNHPAKVQGLVFVDGSMMEGDTGQILDRFRAEIAARGADALIDRMYDGFNVASTPESVRLALARHRAHADPGFLIPLFFDMIRYDTTRTAQVLERLDVPVMVIQSTLLDATGTRVPIREGESTPWTRAVRQHLPGARVVIVSGIGHFPMLEASDRTHALLSGFAQSLPAKCGHDPQAGACSACQ